MSRSLRTQGFAMVEVLLIGIAVVLIAVAGYAVLKQNAKTNKTPTASQQLKTGSTPAAPDVQNASDLTEAEAALDQTNVDATSSDTAELNTQLNGF